MKKRIQIDLHEDIVSTLRAQAIREGRKLKPLLEYVLKQKAREIDRYFSDEQEEPTT